MENVDVLNLEFWKQKFDADVCNYDSVQEYLDFITKASEKHDPERYSEFHHILPRCLDNDAKYQGQTVLLNGADHFRAHQMLAKCFTGKYHDALNNLVISLSSGFGHDATPEKYENRRKNQKVFVRKHHTLQSR